MSPTCAFCPNPGRPRVRYRTPAGFTITQITCAVCEQAIDRWVHAPVSHPTEEHLVGNAVRVPDRRQTGSRRKSA